MKMKLSRLAAITLVTLVVLSLLPIFPAFAAPVISIEPSSVSFTTDTASPGDTFTVTAHVADVSDMFGWQIALYYNASVINCTSATALFTFSPGIPLAPVYATFDSWGVAFIGYSGMAGATPFTGSTDLAEFEFEITASPPKWGSLTSDLIISYKPSGGTYDTKLKDSAGAAIAFSATDGYYEYSWAMPTEPWLTVAPATVLKDEYTNWTDTTFTIDIVLNQLSTAWELVSVSLNKTFDPTLLEVVSVTEGAFLAGFGSTTFSSTVYSDRVFVSCSLDTPYPSVFPYGTGTIATIEFKIIFQGDFGDNRECDLGLENIVLLDKGDVTIPYDADKTEPGLYQIRGYLSTAAPWLEAEDVVVGPEPVQNTFVDVPIWLKGPLDARWELVSLQFRLTYDPEIVEVVEVFNGSFLSAFGPTLPMSADFPTGNSPPWLHPHFLFGDILLPPWTVFPEGEGIIATVRFKILKQYMDPDDIVVDLEFIQIKYKDQNNKDVPNDWGHTKNGTLTILGWSLEGRIIDVYTQYPAPYGGQGPNNPSDLFWPQKEVELYANVTYDWWPVQQKDVAFEIRDPAGLLWTTLVGRTDEYGVASVAFRIPWPCDNPEELFGVWTVSASVDVACIIISDTLWFHFDYLVNIWSVTPNKLPPEYYKHCETITIEIEYGTHAQQTYPAVFTIVIHDALNVPIGSVMVEMTVGGAEFCRYKDESFSVEIHVPKFAFPGIATIHGNCLSALPSEGGSAWCPEETATIIIYPGWIEGP